MDIKGTRTEQNLWNAFSGESMARNKIRASCRERV